MLDQLKAVEYGHGNIRKHQIGRTGTDQIQSGFAVKSCVRHLHIAVRAFDHAAQAWNNIFYWHSLRPAAAGGSAPKGALAEAVARDFGDVAALRQRFDTIALRHFGAGWVWLVQRADGRLGIVSTANAATPVTGDDTPLLAASMWEHAAYPDYRDNRARYLEAFWHLVSWDSVAARLR